jgi:hypothetical protein
MTQHVYSVVGIIPAADRDDANLLAAALRHDVLPGHTFAAPFSADGSEPATHYGYQAAVTQTFVDQITGAGSGVWPIADFGAFGLTEARANELLAAMTLSVAARSVSDGAAHVDATLSAEGLRRIIPDEE